MSDTNENLLARLQACESDLEAHRGCLKALEYGLRATIIVHPAPSDLAKIWSTLLPAIADTHSEDRSTVFTAAFQQTLALLGEQIAAAADKA